MSKQLQEINEYQVAQIAWLARKLSEKRGMCHPDRRTVEVPLSLLNQMSRLANLYVGNTQAVPPCIAQECPLLQEKGGADG